MKILGKIPNVPFIVACSGGMDSMVLVDFLTHYPQNRFEIAFFNHGTSDCEKAEPFLTDWCSLHGLKLHVGGITRERLKQESIEEYWRNQRYGFLDTFDCPVLTAHHLDDTVEGWVMSSIKGGNPRLIPYRRNQVIRPLLLVSKEEIKVWAVRNKLEYVNDVSNGDTSHLRNYVRHIMMPHVLYLNPGIHTMLRKKVIQENKEIV
jgi:tRNA(Ile)-lysidine synthase